MAHRNLWICQEQFVLAIYSVTFDFVFRKRAKKAWVPTSGIPVPIVSMCAFTACEKFWGHFVTSTSFSLSLSLEVPMFSQMSDIQTGGSGW